MGIRIIDHTTDLNVRSDDFLIKDSSTNGTKKITPEAFAEYTNGQMKETVASLTEATSLNDNDLLYVVTPANPNVAKKVKKSTLKSEMKPSDYTGATSSTNGANGLVPQPTTSDVDRFLKGDGTWGDISYAVGEASGSIATFSDGSPLPMRSLKVAIEPQQDLHGYDSPWVGGAGKNKFDESNFNDDTSWQYYTLTLNPNTTYTASSNNGNYYEDNTFPQLYVYATGSGAGSNNAVYTGHSVNITTGSDGVLKVQWKTNNNSKKMTSYHLQVEQGNQATTFAPYSNICPISGWDEVNVNRAKVYQICEPSDSTEITANGVTMTYLGKGKYRVKGTLTTNEYTSLNLPIVPFTIYGGDDCYIKLNNSVGLSAVSIIFKNNSSQVDSWGLYPSNRSGSYVGMRNKYTNNIAIEISSSGYGTNFDFTFKVEILSNSTANLSTYNISFGSVGTVYGGTLDLVSGVMTVDRVNVTVDENSNVISGSGGLPFRIDLLTGAKASSSASALTGVKCNFLKEVTQSSSWGVDGTFSRATTDAKIVYFKVNSEITTIQQLKTFLQSYNLQFVYELATPITIQLTPTQVKSLLGVNNVWADTGDVDAHYVRDLTITIDDILSRLEALEG